MSLVRNSWIRQNKVTKFQQKNDLYKRVSTNYLRHLGRFYTFRQLYSYWQNKIQALHPQIYVQQLAIKGKSVFADIKVEKTVTELKEEAVSFGLQLPHNLVTEIYEFASSTPCTEPGFNDEYLVEDVKHGRLRGGRYVLRGLVNDVMKCNAIQQLVHDPLLLNIVRQYLNYWPTLITQHLTWSFASDLPEAEIKKTYPPINFHYDVAGCNFVTVYFYITDVDLDSGPHIMFKNSQKHKPLKVLLAGSCPIKQTDEEVYSYYGKENELVITGKKGFGFVQDPACVHRLKSPVTTNRLLLQIRYS
ncbi:MAG TPA: hypothetical protein VK203_22115 [Nostocaceae cyanobacterium]|nr:hypothetical protein [Nostocaceae cyanobacterium]